MKAFWARVRKAWHRFWINPESQRRRLGQIDIYDPRLAAERKARNEREHP